MTVLDHIKLFYPQSSNINARFGYVVLRTRIMASDEADATGDRVTVTGEAGGGRGATA
jgi:hypothetical protein